MAKELLKFKAVWCGPCKSLTNMIEGVDLGVPVREIDVDDDSASAIKYSVRSIPTLVLVEDGVEIKRISGVKTVEELKEWIVA